MRHRYDLSYLVEVPGKKDNGNMYVVDILVDRILNVFDLRLVRILKFGT